MNPSGAAVLTHPHPCGHIVYPYTDENLVAQAVSLYASAGLRHDEGVILIMTQGHCEPILRRLTAEGFDVEKAQSTGQLTCLVAEDLMTEFMADGMPDAELFKALMSEIVMRSRARVSNGKTADVRIFGEMVSLLLGSNLPAAVRLEELWDEFVNAHSVSLMCTYTLDGAMPSGLPRSIETLHSHNLAR